MSSGYNVTLVNLAPDARAVAALAHVELRAVDPAALADLLRNFCEIDPIENAVADTEIRVQVRHENYILRTEQKRLILYDVHRRDLPALILTVGEAMRELDGTASAARNLTIQQARADAAPVDAPGTVLPVRPPPPAPSTPRVIGLAVTAGLLLAAIIWLAAPFTGGGNPPGFAPVESAELGRLHTSLTGVYLTGSEPGQHGIVIMAPGEMKLFELAAVEAPRVVYAGYRPGRIGARLCLATDQPGGIIEVTADGNLLYCGEVYQRIP
jgi:hypothetical protein